MVTLVDSSVDRVATELDALSNHDLDAELRAIEQRRRELDARSAVLIAVADARQLYVMDGHRSMKGYLSATCNGSPAEIARQRSMARLVDTHPAVGEAWLAQRIGEAQVAELATVLRHPRAADHLATFLPTLLAQAVELPFADFRIAVAHYIALAEDDGVHDERAEHEARTATLVEVGGSIDLRMSGGTAQIAAELDAIFQSYLDEEYRRDLEARRAEFGDDADCHPLPRTSRQRRFDAVVAVFRSAEAASEAGLDGVAPSAVVNIVAGASTWARMMADAGLAPDDDSGLGLDPFTGLARPADLLDQLTGDLAVDPDRLLERRCETASGLQLHPHDVLRAALTGHVRRMIVDHRSVTIDMGRAKRLFTGSARAAAKFLIRHCEHPGCDLPVDWCEVDHRAEHHEGGATDQANSRIACGPHNRWKHRSGSTVRRARNGRSFTIRADGTVILPVGHPPPEWASGDASEAGADRHDLLYRSVRLGRSPSVEQLTQAIRHLHRAA